MSARSVGAATLAAEDFGPPDTDPFVRVVIEEDAFAVYFDAGRPQWVATIDDDGDFIMWVSAAEVALGRPDMRRAAEAVRRAEAFLAQFRLPAVAS